MLRGPSTVSSGGSIQVEVASGDKSVYVGQGGQGDRTQVPVPPDRKVTIPVPPVPPGTVIVISVGTGLNSQVLLVEVVDTD